MNYKHFILTRWNLGIYSDNPYAEKVGDVEGWMRRRVILFERYCLPSMVAQTCQGFTWVMAFDAATDAGLLERYGCMENVQIIHEQPHHWLRRQPPSAEWLITSRFDNDDIYAPDFVQQIQAAFRERTEVLDIDYQVYDLCGRRYYASGRKRNNSPFLSLVEPWTMDVMTAMGRPHTVMPDVYDSRKLHGVKAVQVIHGGNIMNKITGIEI